MAVSVAIGLLVLRVIAGLTLAGHGTQKLFGWFGGPGFARQQASFQTQGFHPSWLWSALIVLGELGGGLSLACGFLTPLGAAAIFAAMLMAILKVHWKNGFWNSKRGIEFPLSLLTIATAIGIAGPGTYALDTFFGITLPTPLLFVILAVVGLLVDILGLVISRPAAVPAQPSAQ